MDKKLKGIYDALDNGNYKSALKLCTGFLQKQPGHALCKALHAVALERSGRRDEALQICDEVRSAAPAAGIDDAVYTAVGVVYRRCRQFAEVVRLYEAACAGDPETEEYAVLLFVAMLRQGEFAKAQQVATKLYSKHKRLRHVLWLVVALLLQSRAGGPQQVIDLASIMLQKAPVNKDLLNGDGPSTYNRTQVYLVLLHLDALRLRAKYDEALDMLKACEPVVKLPSDIVALRVRLLRDAGRAKEAADEAKAGLLKRPDDWTAVQEYLRLSFECPAPSDLPQQPSGAGAPDHCSRLKFAADGADGADEVRNAAALVARLLAEAEREGSAAAEAEGSVAGSQRARVARLAQLELWRLAFCANEDASRAAADGWRAGVSEGDIASFTTAIRDYITRFAGAGNCFFDLKPFLALLSRGEASALIRDVEKVSDGAPGARVTAGRLRRALSGRAGAGTHEELAAEAQRLLSVRGEGDLPQQDLMLLAIVALLDMDRSSCGASGGSSTRFLVSAVALAEEGVARDPNGFHFKVLLVLLYGALGLPSPMLTWFQTMEVKNIQHETLSYLAFDALCAAGGSEALREASGNVIGFHEDMDKDAADGVQGALQSGVFHRVPEYLDSLRVLRGSVLWGRAVVEETLCEVGQAQTWETMVDAATRQTTILADVMRRGRESWFVCNQDRRLLNGLHPLPAVSPAAAAREAAGRWSAGAGGPGSAGAGALSTVTLQSAWSGAVGSSGLRWAPSAPQDVAAPFRPPPRDGGAASAPAAPVEESAVEELVLAGGRLWTPALLRLLASLQHLLAALLQKPAHDAGLVAESLDAAREAAAAAFTSGAGADAPSSSSTATPALPPSDANLRRVLEAATRAPCAVWASAGAAGFTRLSLHCGLLAGEAAGSAVQCMASGEGWEVTEQELLAATTALEALLTCVRTGGAAPPAEGAAPSPPPGFLAPGGPGVPLVWTALHHAVGTVLPIVLWCCATLPKAGGSGKKVKQGQEALYAARLALRSLLAALQAGLGDIGDVLGRAAATATEPPADGAADPLGPALADAVPALGELPGHSERCQELRRTIAQAHSKHLRSLQEATASHLALLKSRGAFKP